MTNLFFLIVFATNIQQHKSGNFYDAGPPLIVSNASDKVQAKSYIDALKNPDQGTVGQLQICLKNFQISSYHHLLLSVQQTEAYSVMCHCFIFSHMYGGKAYKTLVNLGNMANDDFDDFTPAKVLQKHENELDAILMNLMRAYEAVAAAADIQGSVSSSSTKTQKSVAENSLLERVRAICDRPSTVQEVENMKAYASKLPEIAREILRNSKDPSDNRNITIQGRLFEVYSISGAGAFCGLRVLGFMDFNLIETAVRNNFDNMEHLGRTWRTTVRSLNSELNNPADEIRWIRTEANIYNELMPFFAKLANVSFRLYQMQYDYDKGKKISGSGKILASPHESYDAFDKNRPVLHVLLRDGHYSSLVPLSDESTLPKAILQEMIYNYLLKQYVVFENYQESELAPKVVLEEFVKLFG